MADNSAELQLKKEQQEAEYEEGEYEEVEVDDEDDGDWNDNAEESAEDQENLAKMKEQYMNMMKKKQDIENSKKAAEDKKIADEKKKLEAEEKKKAEAADGKPKKKSLKLNSKPFDYKEPDPAQLLLEQQMLQQQEEELLYEQQMMAQQYIQMYGFNPFEQFDPMQMMNGGSMGGDYEDSFAQFTKVGKQKKDKVKKDVKEQAPKKKKVFKRMIDQVEKKEQGATAQQSISLKKSEKQKGSEVSSLVFEQGKYTVVDEKRDPINIVFIGHVDAGKSTICGQILYLTGKVDMNDLRKYEAEAKEKNRESWYLAYIMDINDEERAKGKTVEVGKAHFQTENKRFCILDAPGHKNYVPNMIAGASQADYAVLVISAKTGEFESGFDKGGQTREHGMLSKSLGVKHLIVTINKMDDVNWDISRYMEIQSQLNPFLKECGYNIDTEITYCPISGLTGDNLLEKKKTKENDWYKGESLLQIFNKLATPNRDIDGPVRIPVLDKMKDMGLFAFGKIESGCIKCDMNLTLMPQQKDFTIVQILNSEDQSVYYAKAGENVKIKTKGIEEDDLVKGSMICNQDDVCQVSQEIECEIQILDLPEHKSIFSTGYSCVLHMHTSVEDVEVSAILSQLDGSGKKTKVSFFKSFTKGIVRIRCSKFLCLEKFEVNCQLGNFTLRDEGLTVAIGKVLRLKPAKKADIEMISEEMKALINEKLAQKQENVMTSKDPEDTF